MASRPAGRWNSLNLSAVVVTDGSIDFDPNAESIPGKITRGRILARDATVSVESARRGSPSESGSLADEGPADFPLSSHGCAPLVEEETEHVHGRPDSLNLGAFVKLNLRAGVVSPPTATFSRHGVSLAPRWLCAKVPR